MVGSREVELDACRVLDRFVVVKLCSVVGGDRVEPAWRPSEQHLGSSARDMHAAVGQLADHRVAGFSFHQCRDAVGGALSDHRINLPVSDGSPFLDRGWAFGDVALAGQTSSAVVAVVSFPSELC